MEGFKKDEVKVQVDNYGHLLVSGERQVNEMKHIHFEQSYRVPHNSNIEDTTAKFEDDILYIIIPKTAKPDEDSREKNTTQADHIQEEKQQNELVKNEVLNGETKIDDHQRTDQEGLHEEEEEEEEEEEGEEEAEEAEEFHDAKKENEWNESSLFGTIRAQLKKNKGIFVAAVLAFSLGVLVSQRFQTNYEK